MEHLNNCLICGEELTCFTSPHLMTCSVCQQTLETRIACKNGHFVCDECHSKEGLLWVKPVCLSSTSRNPIEIINLLMHKKGIHLHGPEHHILVGSALLTAYRNSGGMIELESALAEMERRGRQVPGGVCGFWGACGAGISAGMFISIITGSTPVKKKEWHLSNLITSEALLKIAALGGPRCCKRDSYLSIQTAVVFVQQHLGITMQLPQKTECHFSQFNKECLKEACPFFINEESCK